MAKSQIRKKKHVMEIVPFQRLKKQFNAFVNKKFSHATSNRSRKNENKVVNVELNRTTKCLVEAKVSWREVPCPTSWRQVQSAEIAHETRDDSTRLPICFSSFVRSFIFLFVLVPSMLFTCAITRRSLQQENELNMLYYTELCTFNEPKYWVNHSILGFTRHRRISASSINKYKFRKFINDWCIFLFP